MHSEFSKEHRDLMVRLLRIGSLLEVQKLPHSFSDVDAECDDACVVDASVVVCLSNQSTFGCKL